MSSKFNYKILVPLGFLAISFYAIANQLDGWGWGFFLTVLTYSAIAND